MNLQDFFTLLRKCGYNTYASKSDWEKEMKGKEVKVAPVDIYLKNGYVVHLKKELEPYLVHIGNIVVIATDRKIAFDVGEISTIQIKEVY